MSHQTKVFVLYTGGTIGMANNAKGELVPQSLSQLISHIPAFRSHTSEPLEDIVLDNGICLGFDSFSEPLDSSNISPSHWLIMADKIKAVYDDYDGFVILHGTDTLAYTASALSFIFENLAKPVVISGSQLPISDHRTDGVINLVNAIHVAGWQATGLPCIPEVVVCFAQVILRGCRCTKVSSVAFNGFDSPNFPHLGEIGEQIQINHRLLRPLPKSGHSFRLNRQLDTHVLEISLNPAMTVAQFESMLNINGLKAVVLRSYGSGNMPNNPAFLAVIANFIQAGKLIVNISQCQQNRVTMGHYAVSADLLALGVISGADMTIEAALSKLYWLLGTCRSDCIGEKMLVSQRGELSKVRG